MKYQSKGTLPMHQVNEMTLTFRCLPELETILPRPIPAVLGLPDWFKALPVTAFNPATGGETQTVKKCPPFIDAMTHGFLMPLAADLKVSGGELTWDFELPPGYMGEYSDSPIGFHHPCQAAGAPFCDDDRFIIKFNNFWTIEAPQGYSLLFTHPVNRADLPFTTLTGLVDCDTFCHSPVNFPARWHDIDFSGVLLKGTPVAQCLPVKRESWVARFERLTEDDSKRVAATRDAMGRERGFYRQQFRAPKR
jgi:hypothetical protein